MARQKAITGSSHATPTRAVTSEMACITPVTMLMLPAGTVT
jgi:hypothetical protein